MILLLAIPAIVMGREKAQSPDVFKLEFPDTLKGLHIQFEVKQMKVLDKGRAVWIYCLCADITNKNERAQDLLVRYQRHGELKTNKIEIAGKQQRIILVDKCIVSGEDPVEIDKFYRLLELEYRQ